MSTTIEERVAILEKELARLQHIIQVMRGCYLVGSYSPGSNVDCFPSKDSAVRASRQSLLLISQVVIEFAAKDFLERDDLMIDP